MQYTIAYWIIAEKYAMSTVFGHFVESGQNYDDGSPVWVIFTEEPSETAVTVPSRVKYSGPESTSARRLCSGSFFELVTR